MDCFYYWSRRVPRPVRLSWSWRVCSSLIRRSSRCVRGAIADLWHIVRVRGQHRSRARRTRIGRPVPSPIAIAGDTESSQELPCSQLGIQRRPAPGAGFSGPVDLHRLSAWRIRRYRSEDAWRLPLVDQQRCLLYAGRACLRQDALSYVNPASAAGLDQVDSRWIANSSLRRRSRLRKKGISAACSLTLVSPGGREVKESSHHLLPRIRKSHISIGA